MINYFIKKSETEAIKESIPNPIVVSSSTFESFYLIDRDIYYNAKGHETLAFRLLYPESILDNEISLKINGRRQIGHAKKNIFNVVIDFEFS